ncbi:MAG: hypothetical protein ATN36_06530 [Epulopiscium sp. Nele67-Bin005]|nr:MAG: hypothetical protein ATN36_06530 [Epulopiscium sp. Nele67-Bin005]
MASKATKTYTKKSDASTGLMAGILIFQVLIILGAWQLINTTNRVESYLMVIQQQLLYMDQRISALSVEPTQTTTTADENPVLETEIPNSGTSDVTTDITEVPAPEEVSTPEEE